MNNSATSKTPDNTHIFFPTTYAQILERINQLDPMQYARTRNFINGAVSYLSPYISRGVISGKMVMDRVLALGYKPYQVEKFLQELAWREYFQRVWQHLGEGIWVDIKQAQPDVLHRQMISSIEQGQTGIEAVDRAIQDLFRTGYMHNHVRMYTASLACNVGKAHWMQPSKWMYYHLLDGDIASNNCSWQWVAAAFAGKKYYFDQANVNKYTLSEQDHSFLDRSYETIMQMPVPDSLQQTKELSLSTTLPVTVLPVLDRSKPTLIYNSYNLNPLWRKGEDVNRVFILEPTHFKKYPVSHKVTAFLIELSKNIQGLQAFTGELSELSIDPNLLISKEHPLFTHYPGTKDEGDWMFPEVTGYYPSFFSYWKKCKKYLG